MQRKGSFTRALAGLIGPVATQALIDAFPGERLYIPAPTMALRLATYSQPITMATAGTSAGKRRIGCYAMPARW